MTEKAGNEGGASEAWYRLLFEDNPLPMWVYDCETLRFLAVNHAALEHYGYSHEEFLSMTLRDIRPPDDVPALHENLAKPPMRYGRPEGWRHVKKDGTVIEVEITSHDLSFEGRKARFIVINDITERRKIEAQLLRTQRMESIGTLAAGIAHDLNNVLSPMLMAVELLKARLSDLPNRRVLDALELSATRGARIVRQVLTFARGVQGEYSEIQTRHLISEIGDILSQGFPKSIKVIVEVPAELWVISGDPTQLHQVLLNLCLNARDAMSNGGTLRITAQNRALDEHYAKLNLEAKPGPYVQIEVADTGTGIPQNVIDRIFEPFFTTKEVGKGTGLGLSTAMAIVKGHGGFMNVYSEVQKGTSFKVFLPAHASVEVHPAAARVGEPPVGEGQLVLVADDEATVRDITRLTLESYGYRVVTANDGAEALACYAQRSGEIAVVLLDMMMPVMDGPATIRVLEKFKPTPRVIATSGLTDNARNLTAVVRGVLNKPYTAEQLLTMLHSVLQEL
jgi:PAS domain S-box-containing protein